MTMTLAKFCAKRLADCPIRKLDRAYACFGDRRLKFTPFRAIPLEDAVGRNRLCDKNPGTKSLSGQKKHFRYL